MRHLVLLASLLAGGCALDGRNDKPAALPSPAPIVTADNAPKAPVRIRWRVLSDQGGRLKIEAVLERLVPLRVPVTVRVEVPPGLQLLSGATSFEIPADAPPGETSMPLEFSYADVPPTDLKVVADAFGYSMGVHAADTYRFGRPEPQPVRPQPSGPNIKVGNTDLGPAIQIDKK